MTTVKKTPKPLRKISYKIYEIYSDLIPISYIGCTRQIYLSQRLNDHRKLKDCSAKKIFWFDNKPKIRILEELDINTDIKEVALREQYHIKQNRENVFNERLPGRTKKEYYLDNIERLKEYKKNYSKLNRDKINEYKRKCYKKNKEKKLQEKLQEKLNIKEE